MTLLFSGLISARSFSGTPSPVTWQTLIKVEVDQENRMSKTVTSTAWNGAASSENVLNAGVDGFVTFTLEDDSSAFAVGLSNDPDAATSFYSLGYSILFNSSGKVKIYEGGDTELVLDPLVAELQGVTFKIAREGGQINYYQDDVLIYTSITPSMEDLQVDVSISSGILPVTEVFFQEQPIEPLVITPVITHPSSASALGNISVNVQGGSGAYTYSWSSGETTSSIDQTIGDYSVTVTDGLGNSITEVYSLIYSSQSPLIWQTLIKVEVDQENRLSKTVSSTAWNGAASSENVLAAGMDGSVTFTLEDDSSAFAIGLSNDPDAATSFYSLGYSILFNSSGKVKIYEGGDTELVLDALVEDLQGVTFKIARESGQINYYQDDALIYTSATPSMEDLQVDVSISSGILPLAEIVFQEQPIEPLVLTPTIIHPSSETAQGHISLEVAGGSGAYTYSWSTGETTSSIYQLAGDYAVTVTDGLGSSITEEYQLIYTPESNLVWQSLMNVEVLEQNRLSKTASSTAWNGAASSENVLAAGVDGSVTFTLEDNSSAFAIGLSNDPDVATSFYSLSYSILFNSSGKVKIYEGGDTEFVLDQLIEDLQGAVFKIEKENGQINYHLDDVIFYTSTQAASADLQVDVSISIGRLPIIIEDFETEKLLVSAEFASVSNGLWSDPDTWQLESTLGEHEIHNPYPMTGDEVTIDGHTVTVTEDSACAGIVISGDDNTQLIVNTNNDLIVNGEVKIMKSLRGEDGGRLQVAEGANIRCL